MPACPRRPDQAGVGSAGTPRPTGSAAGSTGEQKGTSWVGEPAAPRSQGSRHSTARTRLPPLAGRHSRMGTQRWHGCMGPTAPLFAPLRDAPWQRRWHGSRAEPHPVSAPPGARLGTAMVPQAGRIPPERPAALPTATAPRAKSNRHQPREVHGGRGGDPARLSQGTLWPLPCVPPCASCQRLARAPGLCRVPWAVPCPAALLCLGLPASAPAPTCARGAGAPGRWPWPRWAAVLASSAPLGSAAVPGGGRPAPVSSSSSVPGEGRDLPAPSANQGEAEARYKPVVAQPGDSSAPCLSRLGAGVASPQAAMPSHAAHGATQLGSLARTRPALCESICACSGYVSSSSTGSPGWHGSRAPPAPMPDGSCSPLCPEPGPHSPCAGRCCLRSFGPAGLGTDPQSPAGSTGLCVGARLAGDLTVIQGWCLLLAEAEGRKRSCVFPMPRPRSGRPPLSKVTGRQSSSSPSAGHRDAKTCVPRDTPTQHRLVPHNSAGQGMLQAEPWQLPTGHSRCWETWRKDRAVPSQAQGVAGHCRLLSCSEMS